MIFLAFPFSIVDSVDTILSSVTETTTFLEENIDISDFPEGFFSWFLEERFLYNL